jgi:DEAD/DEAH box helicase domain-containing protein
LQPKPHYNGIWLHKAYNDVIKAKMAGKRKRIEPTSQPSSYEAANVVLTTSTIPTKSADGGKKPRRLTIGNAPSLLKRTSTLVEDSPEIPWPDYFVQLEKTFKALNLVYTFCCTRKHFATTFDNIKSTVEGHIKKPLTIEIIAQIKRLLPDSINFNYVDEDMLEVHILGMAGSKKKEEDDWGMSSKQSEDEKNKQEVLLFEFIDGDLKRHVQHAKTGEAVKPRRKLKDEELKMPVYSQHQMTNLINKRNTKFHSAVNGFLRQCIAEAIDPMLRIQNDLKAYIPAPSNSRAGTPSPVDDNAKLPALIPEDRKQIAQIITELKMLNWYQDQIVPNGHRVFDELQSVFGDLNFPLSQSLVNALYNTKSITKFYSHQAEAINNLYDGHHVIISTSTSSGKSLIYQVPVLHELERDRNAKAMYIFPTKALAQDQKRSLRELLNYMDGMEDVLVETFDGDTPMEERNNIRDNASIIFTNPDMLHITLLPKEEAWRSFFKGLRFVVVDELHVYNGLFGSHVAFIMRRLRRICAALGNSHVKFISCSATVANPEAHMKTIFGIDDLRLTDFDGSPSGRKEFLCWNSPYKDPDDPGAGRVGGITETARLFVQLILRGVRAIAFCRVRNQCEVLLNATRAELLRLERSEVLARVMGYRGGYSAQDRRRIEKDMFDGKLLGIIATTALELGIDIGSLDAVLICGFPYTIANLRQQSGRAGRRNKDSLTVLVGDSFPTDQHYMKNPDEIFLQPNCELQLDLTNQLILEGHIQCAAFEMPINIEADVGYFGTDLKQLCEERLIKDDQGLYHCNERFRPYPSKHVAIRDTEDDHFAVIDITHGRNVVLEEVEPSRASFTLYEGGTFLHQGLTYLVKEFSPDQRLAKVEHVRVDWTTRQRDYTDIDPIETEMMRTIPNSESKAYFGTILIHAVVYGFFKVDRKNRILDAVEVDNPPIDIISKGMWMDVPASALAILQDRHLNIAASIHAAEHAVLSLLPNFVISMPSDVRTECKIAEKEFANKPSQRKRPARLTFYDAKGGASGSGITAKAFEFADLLLKRAVSRVEACHCEIGCMECINSLNCKAMNDVMSKAGASVILKSLLNQEIDIDALPMGPEEFSPEGIETVVLAEAIRPRRGVVLEPVEIKREEGNEDEVTTRRRNMIDGRAFPRIKIEIED